MSNPDIGFTQNPEGRPFASVLREAVQPLTNAWSRFRAKGRYEGQAADLLQGKDLSELTAEDLTRIDKLWNGLVPPDQDQFLEDRMNDLVPDNHPFLGAWDRAEEAYAAQQREELAMIAEEYANGRRDPEELAYERDIQAWEDNGIAAEEAKLEKSPPRALLSYYEHTLGQLIDAGYSFERADKAAKAEALADQAAKGLGDDVADHGFDKAVSRAAFSEATWNQLGDQIIGRDAAFGATGADRLFTIRDAAKQPAVLERLDREARQTFRLSRYEIGLGEIIESGARTPVGHSLDGMWDSGASRVVDQVVGRDAFSRSTWESLSREIVGETAPPAMQSAKAGITPFEHLAAQRIATRDWSPARKSDTPEFNRVWSGLAEVLPLSGYGTGQDLSQLGRDGEYWQYMGANNSSGEDVHYFRHREHPQHQGSNLWLYIPDKMIGTGDLAIAADQGHDFRNEPRAQDTEAWRSMSREEKAELIASYYLSDDRENFPFREQMVVDMPNLEAQQVSVWAIIEARTGGELPDEEEKQWLREDFAAWAEKATGAAPGEPLDPAQEAKIAAAYEALTTAELFHLSRAIHGEWIDPDHPLVAAHDRATERASGREHERPGVEMAADRGERDDAGGLER